VDNGGYPLSVDAVLENMFNGTQAEGTLLGDFNF
jgi:hypothetical protein